MSLVAPEEALDPNAARIYDWFLSGTYPLSPDRAAAERVQEMFGPPEPGHLPVPQEMALRNRLFLDRAVSWASRQGVRQVLDLGCGYAVGGRVITLPDRTRVTLRDLHQVAADGGPGVRCAYVDKDEAAATYMQALSGDGHGVAAARGDLSDPASVLADPVVRGCIDFRRPVVVVLGLVLQLWPAEAARAITSSWQPAVVPGSVLVVSVPRNDDPELLGRASEAYTPQRFWNHSQAEVEGMFAGTALVPPGVVPARGWQAGWADCAKPDSAAHVLCGVGVTR